MSLKYAIAFPALICAFLLATGCATTPEDAKSEATATKEAAKEKVADAKKSASDTMSKAGDMMCSLNKDKRAIVIEKPENSKEKCVVFYTKFGTKKRVGSSSISDQHCEVVKNKIVKNLEKAGFSCS